MDREQVIERIAEELYDFGGRYGGHGLRWADTNDAGKDDYRQEAKFLLEEFIESSGYLPVQEVQLKVLRDEEIETVIGMAMPKHTQGYMQSLPVSISMDGMIAISRATNICNEAKGKLYRRKENK